MNNNVSDNLFYRCPWIHQTFTVSPTPQIPTAPQKSYFAALVDKINYSISYISNSCQAITGVVTGVFNDTVFRGDKPGEYKDVCPFNSFVRNTFTLTDPSAIRAILQHERNGEGDNALFADGMNGNVARAITGNHNPMTSFQNEHQLLRNFLLPYFSFQNVKQYASHFEHQMKVRANEWIQTRKSVNITVEMRKFTLHMLSNHFLGITKPTEDLHHAIQTLMRINVKQVFLPKWLNALLDYFLDGAKRKEQAETVFREAVKSVQNEEQHLISQMKKGNFTEQQIIDTVKLLFVAGQETTASLLVSLIHELAVHPEWIERIRNELQEQNDKPLLERIQNNKALRYVWLEGLRLHVPVYVISRDAVTNMNLQCEETQETLFIEKGKTVNCDNYFSFRDVRRCGANPNQFDPSRFEKVGSAITNSMQAFGDGPGSCLGKDFATLEVKVALATLITHYNWTSETKSVKECLSDVATIQADHKMNIITRIYHKLRGTPLSSDIFINFTKISSGA